MQFFLARKSSLWALHWLQLSSVHILLLWYGVVHGLQYRYLLWHCSPWAAVGQRASLKAFSKGCSAWSTLSLSFSGICVCTSFWHIFLKFCVSDFFNNSTENITLNSQYILSFWPLWIFASRLCLNPLDVEKTCVLLVCCIQSITLSCNFSHASRPWFSPDATIVQPVFPIN